MSFVGTKFIEPSWFWTDVIPVTTDKLNYLEIGSCSGASVVSFAQTYGGHPNTKLYCIDPWSDYDDYDEYKGRLDGIYNEFLTNINTFNLQDKVVACRGYSHEEIPKFDDLFFDIIFVDGNHNPEYALEDAVLSFRKLKVGGYMVFDDYNWEADGKRGPNGTTLGIEGFMQGYRNRIKHITTKWTSWGLAQVFIQKIR